MIFGWRVHSQRPFPLLPRWNGQDTSPPLTIASGPIRMPAEASVYANDMADLWADGRTVLHPPGGPRVLIENGDRMTVEDGDYTDTERHTWLFSVGIGTLCHQRGRPPLHGAVMEVGGRAVVLAGDSGHGKSTTTWTMVQRGHRLLSDDLAVIDPDTMMVRPAFPSVKLWAAAAPSLAFDPNLRSLPHKEKFFVPMPDRFQAAPLPLGLVIVLQKEPGAARPATQRIPPPLAGAHLQTYVWSRRIGLILDGARTAFHLTMSIARAVPVFVLRRPDDIASLDTICSLIEDLAETADRGAGA